MKNWLSPLFTKKDKSLLLDGLDYNPATLRFTSSHDYFVVYKNKFKKFVDEL